MLQTTTAIREIIETPLVLSPDCQTSLPDKQIYFRQEVIVGDDDTPYAVRVNSAIDKVVDLLGPPSNSDESNCYLAYLAGNREAVADAALEHSQEPYYSCLNYLMGTAGAVASCEKTGKFRLKTVLREALIKAVEHHTRKIFAEVSIEISRTVSQ